MTKFLVSAAAAAIVSVAAFAAAPASAQGVGISVGVNDGYHGHRPYYRHHGYGNGYRPGVRVYAGRSSYRDDCYTKRTVKWRNGKKIVTERRICD